MDTRTKIVKILMSLLENETTKERLKNGLDLANMGLDSLVFIKLVVELENEFDIIFEDEKLGNKGFQSFEELARYIDSLKTK